ncbi:MAG: purine-binding chemotaxis protein CheW [Nitrospirota bacterium]|nr:MAG: purine-binding chemotaxis protein CheW [Nitrospirota bacterium]
MTEGLVRGTQLVVFRIGKEYYGMGIDAIREIVRLPEITEVPDAPDYLEGMINLRGKVVPVVDLKKRLRISGDEHGKSTRVLITDKTETLAGLIVDSVEEVANIEPDSVEPPPEMMSAIGIEYITGVAKTADRLVILLDVKKIMSRYDMKDITDLSES